MRKIEKKYHPMGAFEVVSVTESSSRTNAEPDDKPKLQSTIPKTGPKDQSSTVSYQKASNAVKPLLPILPSSDPKHKDEPSKLFEATDDSHIREYPTVIKGKPPKSSKPVVKSSPARYYVFLDHPESKLSNYQLFLLRIDYYIIINYLQ